MCRWGGEEGGVESKEEEVVRLCVCWIGVLVLRIFGVSSPDVNGSCKVAQCVVDASSERQEFTTDWNVHWSCVLHQISNEETDFTSSDDCSDSTTQASHAQKLFRSISLHMHSLF